MFPGRRLPSHLSAGTVEIESQRAIAEAQGKLIIAQRFPRNTNYAAAEILTACRYKSLAEEAFYSYSRGGETIGGPSIRLAEEIARCWGNIEYGIRELSQADGVSEMEAFAWDLQTNTISSQKFTVKHIRDKKSGTGTTLTSQRDIYELTANMGGRRLRARILAVIPKWLIAEATAECRKTLAGDNTVPIAERVRKMIAAFAKHGVTPQHLEARLRKGLDAVLPDDLVDLQGIHTSLKDGQSTASDWFDLGGQADGAKPATGAAAAILNQAKGAEAASPKPAAQPTPAESQAAGDAKQGAQPDPKPETKPAAAAATPAAAAQPAKQTQQSAGAKLAAAKDPEDLF